MISIVLMEPENPGNIGAIARVMANFDLGNLVLVNPKVDHLNEQARCRAKHAQNILKKARVIKKKGLWDFDCIIGTTAKTGTDYNIPRSPLIPSESVKLLSKKLNIALLFGREGKGLYNTEIQKCDFIIKIPASRKYGTLNISHAAAIIFYELFISKKPIDKIEYAKKEEKDVLMSYINKRLNKIKFSTPDKKQTQKKVWRRVIGKSFLTKREAFALIGFFKK